MSEANSIEALFGTDLKRMHRELISLYWRWVKDMMSRKSASDCYSELHRIEFSMYNIICEDIIRKSSELVADLNRLFFGDTSKLGVAIAETKRQKVKAEREFAESEKKDESIELMKNAVNELFKVYSDWKVTKPNFERNAFKNWVKLAGAIYFPAMLVYFAILTFMQIKPDFTLGITVPAFVGFVCILPIIVLFSAKE